MVGVDEERDLMGSEGAFDLQAVHDLGARPAFRRTQDDYRPALSAGVVIIPGIALDAPDFLDGVVHGGGH